MILLFCLYYTLTCKKNNGPIKNKNLEKTLSHTNVVDLNISASEYIQNITQEITCEICEFSFCKSYQNSLPKAIQMKINCPFFFLLLI